MRLLPPDANLVLFPWENAALHDNPPPLSITQMSSGSSAALGGVYSEGSHEGEHFAIDDDRTPSEIARLIAAKGYEVVW